MRKIGYARVSTSTQSLDRQIGALRAERCREVYREKASGKATKGRPQLEKAIDALGTGDVLVVAEWDRATRSMMEACTSSSASTHEAPCVRQATWCHWQHCPKSCRRYL